MDLDQQLRNLPPEVLEVIRYFSTLSGNVAHAGEIIAETGLSDRAFGRAIRRLVTRGYLVMDGEQQYRLTDLGQRAVDTFAASDDGTDWSAQAEDADEAFDPSQIEDTDEVFDSSLTEDTDEVFDPTQIEDAEDLFAPAQTTTTRRLVVALPRALVAGQATTVHVGFEAAAAPSWAEPVSLLVRLSVVNGEPARAPDWAVRLDDDGARRAFEVTAGQYTRARLRVGVFQVRGGGDEVDEAGGLYVDVDVQPEGAAPEPLTAYGADVALTI